MKLSDYLNDLGQLLHDQNWLFTSKYQATRWVNEARRQMAQRTGCIRRLITGQSAFGASAQPGFAIPGGMQPGALPGALPGGTVSGAAASSFGVIAGLERYPYQGFINPVAQQQYDGVDGVIDCIDVSVSWGGSVRPALSWKPWDEFQAYMRAYATLVTSYPYYWSTMDDGTNGELWFFPTPSFAGDLEVDALCTPTRILTDDDYDIIPDNFADGIKFLAARLAYLGSQRYVNAAMMNDLFEEWLGVGGAARDTGKVSNYYAPII